MADNKIELEEFEELKDNGTDPISIDEFRSFLTGLIIGKGGALPDLNDWKIIKKMLDRVTADEIITLPQLPSMPIDPFRSNPPPFAPYPHHPPFAPNIFAPNPFNQPTWIGDNTGTIPNVTLTGGTTTSINDVTEPEYNPFVNTGYAQVVEDTNNYTVAKTTITYSSDPISADLSAALDKLNENSNEINDALYEAILSLLPED